MRKGTGTKTRISITIDQSLVEELNSICKSKFMKISPFVEHLIKIGLEEFKVKNKK